MACPRMAPVGANASPNDLAVGAYRRPEGMRRNARKTALADDLRPKPLGALVVTIPPLRRKDKLGLGVAAAFTECSGVCESQ